ncbi:MAG: hypothetical protein KDD58_10890, partial [Bdellovibrionales bacterium]|nr:hypothetical protein [Bdellovibrionales bacterium]
MRIFNFTWLIPLIISGCATQITKEENYYKIQAPNIDIDQSKDRISVIYYLEGARKSTQSESERLWYEYKLAQIYKESSDPRACALFKNLGLNKTFPLNREATLNEIESCQDHADPNAEMARIDTTATLPWLKNRGLEVSILIAEKYKMHEQLINLYLEKSKQPLEQKEKVEYTKKALNLAIKHFPKEKENIRQRIYMLAPRYN